MLLKIIEKAMTDGQMAEPGQSVAVALSGGRDSVCLLHALKALETKLGYRLSAVHVNHGLRREADQDESFCRQLCRSWCIPLTVYRADVRSRAQSHKESIEEAARRLRYAAFEKLPAQRIALAHHQKDQAETVLLHLLRGSGLTGLCGMRPVRLPYIRPLLSAEDGQMTAYQQQHSLPFVEDLSNYDTAFRRNQIRHELLPLLQQSYNPEIVQALARMAENLQQDETYMERQLPQVPDGPLSIPELLGYPEGIRRRILRNWLAKAGGSKDITQQHIRQLMDLAAGASGRRVNLPKGLTVSRSYDILRICERIPDPQPCQAPPQFEMEWIPVSQLWEQWNERKQIPALPEEKWLDADRLEAAPVWRTRKPGDYLIASGGKKKLKEYLIDQKIPREERDRLLLLADGSHVIWVFGYRLSDGVKITENTRRVLHIRRI